MTYEYAISVLRKRAFELGGELFAREATMYFTELKAKSGDEEAQEELKLSKFIEKMFSVSIEHPSEREKRFWQLLKAMTVLANSGESQTENSQ